MNKQNNLYFLFVPIADKKKFLSLLITAPDENIARWVIKKEMPLLFPGDRSLSDEEIVNFHDLDCSEDILIEIMKLGPQGQLIEGSWIAVTQDGQTYTLDGFKDREEVKKEFKKHYDKEHPNVNFTGDLYALVAEQYVVLMKTSFTDEFLQSIQFDNMIPGPNTTIH